MISLSSAEFAHRVVKANLNSLLVNQIFMVGMTKQIVNRFALFVYPGISIT